MWSRRRVMAMLVAAAGAAGTTQLRAFANTSGQVEQCVRLFPVFFSCDAGFREITNSRN